MLSSDFETIYLGSSPTKEDGASAEENSTHELWKEAVEFRKMMEDRFPIPSGVFGFFKVKSEYNNSGIHYEVVFNFDSESDKASDFAIYVENNLPEFWSDGTVFYFPNITSQIF